MERTVPLGKWRNISKEGWHQAIIRWNRLTKNMVKIASAKSLGTSIMTPDEKKDVMRRRNHKVQGASYQAWDEVPTKLPYRFIYENEVPVAVAVDEQFISMVKLLPSYPKPVA